MRLLLVLAFILTGLQIQATEIPNSFDSTNSGPMILRNYELCNSWHYNVEARGYICSYTSYTDLADGLEIQRLESRISALERKIAELLATK